MSRVQEAARQVYDNYAVGQTGSNVQYVQGGQLSREQTYTTGESHLVNGASYYVQNQGPTSSYKNQNQSLSTGYAIGQSHVQRAVAEEIPVESRIEYIPFEKKYTVVDQVERIIQVPFEREIIEYEEVTRTERIPVERTITDYYAVETQVEYVRKETEETIRDWQPVETITERVQYLPVETQIVHYPEQSNFVPQGKYIQAGYAQSNVQQTATYVPTQSGVRTETVYQTGYVPVNSAVGQYAGQYVTGGQTQYATGGQYVTGGQQYVSGGQYVTGGQTQYTTGGQTQYTTGQYTTGVPQYTTGQTQYTTGQYVTGGSGVRGETVYRTSQTGGYVTGGSGVRHN